MGLTILAWIILTRIPLARISLVLKKNEPILARSLLPGFWSPELECSTLRDLRGYRWVDWLEPFRREVIALTGLRSLKDNAQ